MQTPPGGQEIMQEYRIVFFGTAAFAVPTLDALMTSEGRPVAVYTRADQPAGRGRRPRQSPVKERALQYGLEVLEPATLRTAKAVDQLRALEPTVLATAAYGLILPPGVLAVPPRGAINAHPSLLPRHRGPAPVVSTILEGDEDAGVSVFLLDDGVDTGPLLAQRVVPIRAGETAGELTERLARFNATLMVETLGPWLSGEISPVPQDEALATQSRLLTKSDGVLDFGLPAAELERRVLAMTPWPGAFTTLGGKRLGILRAVALPSEYDAAGAAPGFVRRVRRSEDGGGAGIAVATGEGLLELLELQPEGRRVMSAREFLSGHPDFIGSVLPS